VKIFSYIINFVRFRESQTATIDEHFNKSETTKARIETLYLDNQDMEQRLGEMKRNRKAVEIQVKEKVKRNDDLKARLLEIRNEQLKIAEKFERVKADKARSQAALEERMEKLMRTKQESEKLRPYVQQSLPALQASLAELSDSLVKDKSQVDALERRARALQTSSDTFAIVTNDVQGCIKILEEISTELQKEEDENIRAAKNREALAERGNNVREVERHESLLQKKLSRVNERTESLRKASQEKANAAKQRMEELRGVHRKLTEERGEKGREMERRRVRIEQTEKKVRS
jgi:kinetochore protein Nuf2